jgi:hypothetical protein
MRHLRIYLGATRGYSLCLGSVIVAMALLIVGSTPPVIANPSLHAHVQLNESLARQQHVADELRRTPHTGQFTDNSSHTLTVPIDTNGVAEAVFQVTMQPGDNFRVVAVIDPNTLTNIVARHPDAEARAFTNDVPISDDTTTSSSAKSTPVLTVWRRVHLEVDSMAAVPDTGPQRNLADGNIVQISGNVANGQVAVSGTNNHFVTGLPNGITDNSEHLPNGNGRFENGRVRIGLGLWTDNLLGNAAHSFWTKGTSVAGGTSFHIPFTAVPPSPNDPFIQGQIVAMLPASQTGQGVKGEFVVDTALTPNTLAGGTLGISNHSFTILGNTANRIEVDTDDPTLAFVLYDDDSAAGTPLPRPDTSRMQPAFAPAYIVPIEGTLAGDETLPFLSNIQTLSGGNVEDGWSFDNEPHVNPEFWVMYVRGAFQDDTLEDRDPDSESVTWGIANGIPGTGVNIYYEAHIETAGWTPPNMPGHGYFEADTVVHEIGHLFGSTHAHGGIMGDDVVGTFDSIDFTPASLNVIRNYNP